MKRRGSAAPRYLSFPISVLMAVGVAGAATVQPAGAQSIMVVRSTATGCGGHPPAFTKIQAAVNAATSGRPFSYAPGSTPNRWWSPRTI
jgi:hypothetical protein